ncbi:MAG: DUF4430 domain-containing protein [Lysinibacillus sp.]
MHKKWLIPLLAMLLTCFLTACTIETVEQHEKQETHEKSVDKQQESNAVEEKQDNPNIEETVSQDKSTQELEKDKQTNVGNDSQEKQAENKPEKNTVTEKQDGQENNAAGVPSKPQTPKPDTTKPAEKKRYVTIAIHAKTLLKNWNMLDPALQSEKYVPKDGVILKTSKYELLSEDDTVWTVLSRAVKEHNIQMEYQGANENIYKSVYVEGINHLYEFSAGELSGWMYKVNGVYPNYGCSQYVLKDGDVIEWNYTVDLGRDLGQVWVGE